MRGGDGCSAGGGQCEDDDEKESFLSLKKLRRAAAAKVRAEDAFGDGTVDEVAFFCCCFR